MVRLSVTGDVLGQPNAYMLDKTNGANLVTIAVGHSLDILRTYAAFAADIHNGTHTVPDFADAVRRQA
jgi:hypothetical protein